MFKVFIVLSIILLAITNTTYASTDNICLFKSNCIPYLNYTNFICWCNSDLFLTNENNIVKNPCAECVNEQSPCNFLWPQNETFCHREMSAMALLDVIKFIENRNSSDMYGIKSNTWDQIKTNLLPIMTLALVMYMNFKKFVAKYANKYYIVIGKHLSERRSTRSQNKPTRETESYQNQEEQLVRILEKNKRKKQKKEKVQDSIV